MSDKTSTFLLRASTLLPSNCPAFQTMKTHLISKCKKIGNVTFNAADPYICSNCGNYSSEIYKTFTVRIKKHLSFKRSLRRLLVKSHIPSSRTFSLYNKFKNLRNNQLVVVCKVCSHKNIQFLTRPVILKKKVIKPLKKSKKKKTKDKFAGLNPNAVIKSQNTEKVHFSNQKNKKGIKLNKNNILRKKHIEPMKVSKKNIPQSNKIAKLLNNKKQKTKSSVLEQFISTLV